MTKSNAVLGVLLAASLLWAYMLTHLAGGGPVGDSSLTIWNVPPQQITRLDYRNGETRVVVRPDWSEGADTPYIWVETRRPRSRPGRGKRPAAPAEPATETAAFKGNEFALSSLRHFAAAPALRAIGLYDELDAGEFGFPAPEHYLEIARVGERPPLRLELGRNTFGKANQYAHFTGNGRVYLMRSAEFRRLAQARARMLDRELLAIKPTEAARIELRAGGLRKSFFRLAAEGQWGQSPEDERSIEAVTAFLAALSRLKVLSYTPPEENEPADEFGSQLEVWLYPVADSEQGHWVKVLGPEMMGSDGIGKKKTTVIARSSHSRARVNLSRPLVEQMLREARGLLQGT